MPMYLTGKCKLATNRGSSINLFLKKFIISYDTFHVSVILELPRSEFYDFKSVFYSCTLWNGAHGAI